MAVPVWATNDVPSASDFNVWLTNINFAYKTSDTSRASTTTVTDDPHLTVPVAINSVYMVTVMLNYDAVTAADFKYLLNTPAGCTFAALENSMPTTATVPADVIISGRSINGEGPAGGLGAGTIVPLVVQGLLTVGSTAGSFKVQWSQNTSNATATILKANSYIFLQRGS
jgi:hypothetical protein